MDDRSDAQPAPTRRRPCGAGRAAPPSGARRSLLVATLAAASPLPARAQWLWVLRAPRDWAEVDRELAARHPDVPMMEHVALAALLAAAPAPVLLDVRSPAEWAVSRIPGARPAFEDALVAAALAGVPPSATVVAYCAIGLRSARLADRLAAAGRPGVHNLRHGIFGWADAGRPLQDDRGPAQRVHPYDAGWGRLVSDARRAPLPGR
jgi:rhodanese-related sulfurtransferase